MACIALGLIATEFFTRGLYEAVISITAVVAYVVYMAKEAACDRSWLVTFLEDTLQARASDPESRIG
jgi:hypothetical protein